MHPAFLQATMWHATWQKNWFRSANRKLSASSATEVIISLDHLRCITACIFDFQNHGHCGRTKATRSGHKSLNVVMWSRAKGWNMRQQNNTVRPPYRANTETSILDHQSNLSLVALFLPSPFENWPATDYAKGRPLKFNVWKKTQLGSCSKRSFAECCHSAEK
jgi:hypothetical protein